MARWIKLETWAAAEYGEDAPCKRTLVRWATNDNLQPPAEKHGQCWYVKPGTKYKTAGAGSSLLDRMRAEYGTQAA